MCSLSGVGVFVCGPVIDSYLWAEIVACSAAIRAC